MMFYHFPPYTENNIDTLDISGKKLKKLIKPILAAAQVTTLILDDNELQRLDNLDSYTKLQKVAGPCMLYSIFIHNTMQILVVCR